MSGALRHDLRAKLEPLAGLVSWERNPRINDAAAVRLARTIEAHGWTTPILVQASSGRVIAGHTRLKAAQILGLAEVPVIRLDVDDRRATEIALADNRLGELAEWNEAGLAELLAELDADGADLDVLGWGDDEIKALLDEMKPPTSRATGPSLADRFVVPPFSVLDQRQGYWRERRDKWLALGIRSEEGRSAVAFRDPGPGDRQAQYRGGLLDSSVSGMDPAFYAKKRGAEAATGLAMSTAEFKREHYVPPSANRTGLSASGTSVFDPVLCELAYRWFAPAGGTVLDPFAGGSVRGLVAGILGMSYVGIDLSARQIAANEEQRSTICTAEQAARISWILGDSNGLDALVGDVAADLVFTCPPYFDLEVYSDDARDLSAGSWDDFVAAYTTILRAACGRLREDRFAVVVVGDVRDRRGAYRGVVDLTRAILVGAELAIWNEAILVSPLGALPIRAGRAFQATRKLGRAHQVVVVAYKGDPARIRAVLGDVEIAEMPQEEDE